MHSSYLEYQCLFDLCSQQEFKDSAIFPGRSKASYSNGRNFGLKIKPKLAIVKKLGKQKLKETDESMPDLACYLEKPDESNPTRPDLKELKGNKCLPSTMNVVPGQLMILPAFSNITAPMTNRSLCCLCSGQIRRISLLYHATFDKIPSKSNRPAKFLWLIGMNLGLLKPPPVSN